MIPLELVELIVEQLDDPESVYACSLVCKSWRSYIFDNDRRLFRQRCRYSEREAQSLDHTKLVNSLRATSVTLAKLGPFFSRWYTNFLIDRYLATNKPIEIPAQNAPFYLNKIPKEFSHILFAGHGLEANYMADPTHTIHIGDSPFGLPAFRGHINLTQRTLHYNRDNPGYNSSPKYQNRYPILGLDGEDVHFSLLYASFGDGLSVYAHSSSDGVGYIGIFNRDFTPIQIWSCALTYYSKIWFVLDGAAILVRTVGSSMYFCRAESSGCLVRDISEEVHLGDEMELLENDYFATSHHLIRFNTADWTLHSAPIREVLAKKDLNLVTWAGVTDCGLFRREQEWRQYVFWDFDGRFFYFRLSRPLPSYNYLAVVDLLRRVTKIYVTRVRLGSQMIMDAHGRVAALTMEAAERLIEYAIDGGREDYSIDFNTLEIQ
ncbi:hypothetical protein TRVA0_029S00430 [Trichomonascus vanleenenianus]|uniref:F-box protein n=1 Tax=Trichomonascus vanleenenianus TaxID=2268995 RepID=UPI003ECB680B